MVYLMPHDSFLVLHVSTELAWDHVWIDFVLLFSLLVHFVLVVSRHPGLTSTAAA